SSEEEQPKEATKSQKRVSQAGGEEHIATPLEGKVLPLSEANDAAFSAGVMGKGAVIEPTLGEVYAPFDGQVMTVFPTKHAIGLISDQGTELLIHVGIDTVQLEGKYFESFVSQGQKIQKGDLLLKFDMEAIEAEGFSTQVPIIVTNSSDFEDIVITDKTVIHKAEELLTGLVKTADDLVVQPV
ncbi:MAG: glucose PTS transporter subunit IIA, partial [Lactococcus sp.]